MASAAATHARTSASRCGRPRASRHAAGCITAGWCVVLQAAAAAAAATQFRSAKIEGSVFTSMGHERCWQDKAYRGVAAKRRPQSSSGANRRARPDCNVKAHSTPSKSPLHLRSCSAKALLVVARLSQGSLLAVAAILNAEAPRLLDLGLQPAGTLPNLNRRQLRQLPLVRPVGSRSSCYGECWITTFARRAPAIAHNCALPGRGPWR